MQVTRCRCRCRFRGAEWVQRFIRGGGAEHRVLTAEVQQRAEVVHHVRCRCN